MRHVYSEADFLDKVSWEGSLLDAFEYGLTPENCEPGHLHDLLVPAHEAYIDFMKAAQAVVLYADGTIEIDDEEDEQ